jgi:integrase
MPGPWKHPATGTYYLRERVPADLKRKAAGQSLELPINGSFATVRIGREHVKASLRTKDPKPAKEAFKVASAALGDYWEALRKGPRRLTHRETVALAGEAYAEVVSGNEDDPGSAEKWLREEAANLLAEFGMRGKHTGHGKYGLQIASHEERRGADMEARFGPVADTILRRHRLIIDRESRQRLLAQVLSAVRQGHLLLVNRAGGDYRPDLRADRFGEWASNEASPPSKVAVTISGLFDGWAQEVKPAERTKLRWQATVTEFISFIKHDDARALTRGEVVAWKDALVAAGKAAKTINGSKLAPLKTILTWGVDNERIDRNPADGVGLKARKRSDERMRGFSDTEAAAILQAATKENRPAYHWIPRLCASSGARVSEIAQLRGADIKPEHGIPVLEIKGEAGSVKNQSSARSVPIHPKIIAEGFLDFVKERGGGPLFYDPSAHDPKARTRPALIVSGKVAAWVRGLGIKVGRAYHKDPNHAWRHRFHTKARAAGVQDSVADLITGRVPRGSAGGYGKAELRTMRDAVSRIPI